MAQLVDKDTVYESVIKTPLIGVPGVQTPAGSAGQVRPSRSEATRRLTASPAKSQAPGMEINRPVLLPNQ
ncbi:hypothetical protein [Bacillus sp. JJ1122]|uniref:hypothetical protein n=1 Tax=Bacillus sp. JJ1122 TaxID=3122951 RepID=UPI002FFEE6B5